MVKTPQVAFGYLFTASGFSTSIPFAVDYLLEAASMVIPPGLLGSATAVIVWLSLNN